MSTTQSIPETSAPTKGSDASFSGGRPSNGNKSGSTAPSASKWRPKSSKTPSGAASTPSVDVATVQTSQTGGAVSQPDANPQPERVPVVVKPGDSIASGLATTVERAKKERAQQASTQVKGSRGGNGRKPKNAEQEPARAEQSEAKPATGRHFSRPRGGNDGVSIPEPREEDCGRPIHQNNYRFAARMLEVFCETPLKGGLLMARVKLMRSENTLLTLSGAVTSATDFLKKISKLFATGLEDVTEAQLRKLLFPHFAKDRTELQFTPEFRGALIEALNYQTRLRTCERLRADCEEMSLGEFIVTAFAYAIVTVAFTHAFASRGMSLLPRLATFIERGVSFAIGRKIEGVQLDSDEELRVLVSAEMNPDLTLDKMQTICKRLFNNTMNQITRYLTRFEFGKRWSLFSNMVCAYEKPCKAGSDSASASASASDEVNDEDVDDDVPDTSFSGTRFFGGAKAAVCEHVRSAIGLAADRQANDLSTMFVANLVSTGPKPSAQDGQAPTYFGVRFSDDIMTLEQLQQKFREWTKKRDEKRQVKANEQLVALIQERDREIAELQQEILRKKQQADAAMVLALAEQRKNDERCAAERAAYARMLAMKRLICND